MKLPEEPNMLVSFINMKLRDGDFSSLEDLCRYYDENFELLKEKLEKSGFVYIEDLKQFR